MRLLRRFAPRNDKIVYRITYKVYRLNTVASWKFFQGLSRGRIPLDYWNCPAISITLINSKVKYQR